MKYKLCVFYFLYNVCLKHFIFYWELSEIWSKMSIGLHVNYRYSCPILRKLEFSPQSFEKDSNIKFHENTPSRISAVACDRMDGQIDWRTDKTNPIVTFRNFPNLSLLKTEIYFFIYNNQFTALFCHFNPAFQGGHITCPSPSQPRH